MRKHTEAQAGTSTSTASAASSPIFGQSAPIFASHMGTDTQSTSSLNTDSRPNLSKVSTTSSAGTGPIFSRPSGMFATHGGPPSAHASFTSQRNDNLGRQPSPSKASGAEGVSSSGLCQSDLSNSCGGSSHSLGGVMSGKASGLEERPYMNLSDVRQGLSSQCSKWGNSVSSELHKAISSAGEGASCLCFQAIMHRCGHNIPRMYAHGHKLVVAAIMPFLLQLRCTLHHIPCACATACSVDICLTGMHA